MKTDTLWLIEDHVVQDRLTGCFWAWIDGELYVINAPPPTKLYNEMNIKIYWSQVDNGARMWNALKTAALDVRKGY